MESLKWFVFKKTCVGDGEKTEKKKMSEETLF
jgi:hypothetical protein